LLDNIALIMTGPPPAFKVDIHKGPGSIPAIIIYIYIYGVSEADTIYIVSAFDTPSVK
jgi:hypothetical protein